MFRVLALTLLLMCPAVALSLTEGLPFTGPVGTV